MFKTIIRFFKCYKERSKRLDKLTDLTNRYRSLIVKGFMDDVDYYYAFDLVSDADEIITTILNSDCHSKTEKEHIQKELETLSLNLDLSEKHNHIDIDLGTRMRFVVMQPSDSVNVFNYRVSIYNVFDAIVFIIR